MKARLAALGLACAACSSTQLAWQGHTPDRTRRVEVFQRGAEQWLEVGTRSSRRYRFVAADRLAFSDDGRRTAFAAELLDAPGRWVVVTDFVEGPRWEGVAAVRFGPSGRTLAYAAEEHGRWRVVIDGAAGAAHDEIDGEGPVFSADGTRVGYVARDGACAFAVFDQVPGPCVARVEGIAVAPLAARDVALIHDGSRARVYVGGQLAYECPSARALFADPRAAHWAIVAKESEGERLVLDGREEQAFDRIEDVVFAPDGHAVAYVARLGESRYAVFGGKPGAPHAAIDAPVFSADGAHTGLLTRDRGESVVRVDERVVWTGTTPATGLTLSSDGRRAGWLYHQGTDTVIAVDGERYPFELAVERTLRFSKDGKHWGALVGSRAERRLYIVIDGRREVPVDAAELFGNPSFDPGARLAAWVAAELALHAADGGGAP